MGSISSILEARHDLLAFLEFVYIPDQRDDTPAAVKFELWPHILQLHEDVEAVPPAGTLPHLKSRKIGITSYFEARFLWKALFRPGTVFPVTSKGQPEARQFISDCKFIHDHLPKSLQGIKVDDNLDTLGFRGGGIIRAFPATSGAGRSYTGTEVLMDEADFHETFRVAYDTQMPLIGDTGGKLFVVSTKDPETIESDFVQVYLKASNRLFLGYYSRPNRTEEGYEAARLLAADEANFEKENARTEDEALSPPKALAYFNVDALKDMMRNQVSDPIEQTGNLSIWKHQSVGRNYILSGDTAWGNTGSYSNISVDDWGTAEQVAELHGRLAPWELAYEIVELHKKYNHAYIGIERAGEGQERDGDEVVVVKKVVELLKNCSCKDRLYYDDFLSANPKSPGWVTSAKTRTPMLGDFREAVRERQVMIHSRGGLQEMMSFIYKDGRAQASKGAFDDRVMCYAIGWAMREFARFKIPRKPPEGGLMALREF